MRIDLHLIRQPILFVKEILYSIFSRIILDGMQFYFYWSDKNHYQQIVALTEAINMIERILKNKDPVLKATLEESLDTHLSNLRTQDHGKAWCEINQKQLLESLKIHRYSIKLLWNGVGTNQDLTFNIHSYVSKKLPSPIKKLPTPEPSNITSSITKLNFDEQ